MRILWNNHRDARNPKGGGAERTIQAVGGWLVSHGHRVDLLTVGWPGAAAEETLDGVQIHRFPGALGPHLALPGMVRSVRPDAVVDDLGHVLPWMSPQLTRSRGVAFFRHLHRRTLPGQVPAWLVPPLAAVERLYPRIYRSWRFAVESASSTADLVALGVAPDRITRIPPGVDLLRFVPGDRSPEPSLVFFAGLREYKRPDHVLKALGILHRKGVRVRLTIVGTSEELPNLRQLAADLGVAESVTFPGRLPDEALAELLRSAWVNVNCSVAEGWGYSILEAAASGVPTAGYDVPGVNEAIGSGDAGIVVRDGDLAALAQGIEGLLGANDSWRRPCRSLAERYPWSACGLGWERLLRATSEGAR
ncbi:MAG: glycosyltransferase family 4 protein [Thermoplasmata archaeon]|nr:glycosyltransferase family 4 protein [Thermoplasmata archaeon]